MEFLCAILVRSDSHGLSNTYECYIWHEHPFRQIYRIQ